MLLRLLTILTVDFHKLQENAQKTALQKIPYVQSPRDKRL